MASRDFSAPVALPHALAARMQRALRGFDMATDLAEDIGTARWFRGLGVMLGGIGLAVALWPGQAAAPAIPSTPMDAATREEWRSQTVQPLLYGGDTGRRMGPTARLVPLAQAPERPSLDLSVMLAQEDSIEAMLNRAGVSAADNGAVRSALASAVALEDIAPGTRFALHLGQAAGAGAARRLESLSLRARFDLDLTLTRSGAGFVVARHVLPVDSTPLRIRGVAGTSVYRAARAAGAPMKAIQQFLAAIDAHLSLDQVHQGDVFDMVVDYKRAPDGQVEVGDLEYAAIESGGHMAKQLLRWGRGRDAQFYDASDMAEQRATQALVMPVAGARISSGFGLRLHPILGFARMHAGTDLAAPWGAPVYAVADALVNFVGPHGGHGNYIRLDHGGAVSTGYGHLSRFAVAPGMRVRAGQVIGYVGSTGLSTGAHLHYEVFRGGQAVDPMSVGFTVRAGVDRAELAAFRARLGQMLHVKPSGGLGPVVTHMAMGSLPRAAY
ncbi:M23 family metallopeptidase [Novosphingobium sp. KACC 22771]|uniref:M23 family metallopeptidase n=1 Tax=Novosphingobium sp. KACC 22771 TaxID=3025670 RepID=UPI0023653E59|nr:M23 family metallopeptidase [Novosphingobium sp. KACC 22771]WDF72687.1 M23 family metallopeptidase [Novosphingobium sp. KACC 22771]